MSKKFRIQIGLEAEKTEARGQKMPCTFLGGGAEKRTAPPFGGGMLRLCGHMPPAAKKNHEHSVLLGDGMLAASSTNLAL